MKISSDKKTLLKSLSLIQGIVEKTSIKPITSNALICADQSGMSVSATNLQIGLKSNYKNIEVIEEGSISINAKKLFEIIKELPDERVDLSEHDNYRIEIKCGENVEFKISGLPPEDFPLFFKENEMKYIKFPILKFLNLIDYTSFSISHDETKKNICGAYFENIEENHVRMVTTDGYRLSIINEKIDETIQLENGFMNIPQKAILEIGKILYEKTDEEYMYVCVEKNNLWIKVGEIEFVTQLIDKKFPDFSIIIPKKGYKHLEIKIKKEILLPTLRRMSIISQEHNTPVVFSFQENKIEIATEDDELGSVKEIVPIEESVKDKFSFCINCRYLFEVLNTVNDDVIIEINSEEKDKPIVVKPVKKENIQYIIMPMILDEES